MSRLSTFCLLVVAIAAMQVAASEPDFECMKAVPPARCNKDSHAVRRTPRQTKHVAGPIVQDGDCALLNFEGVGNQGQLSTYLTANNLPFGASSTWFTYVDSDAGGFMFSANEPSPETGATGNDQAGDFTFANGCTTVSAFFSSPTVLSTGAVIFKYYDASNNLLQTSTRTDNGFDLSKGDPTGGYSIYYQESFTSNAAPIARLEVSTQKLYLGYVIIDDLKCCGGAAPCTGTSSKNCVSASQTSSKKQACLSFNDDDVCAGTTQSGDC